MKFTDGKFVAAVVSAMFMVSIAGLVYAVAALTNASAGKRYSGKGYVEQQLIRCDVGGGVIADAGSVVNGSVDGESCEAGDWTAPLDCRGYTTIGVWYHLLDSATSGTAQIWNCNIPEGVIGVTDGQGSIATLGLPGAIAPSTAPTDANPGPLCVDLLAGAGVTMAGTTAGVQYWSDGPIDLGFIVGEIGACSTCDGILHVRCSGGV